MSGAGRPKFDLLEDGMVEEALSERLLSVLPREHPVAELSRYYDLLRDYPERGGKRLRAKITLLSTQAHGGPWQAGLTAAAAIELFQNWVLVHDDIEDDSDERRGRPTLHRRVGVPLAINVGDGLHAYMWQLLLDAETLPRQVLDEFLWLVHRTAEGQHCDLAWVAAGRFDVSEAEYLEMVRLKTACYTVVSPLRLGALSLGVEPAPELSAAGEALGVAFQIRDDVLNLSPDLPHGKEFAGDLFEGKRTLILAHFFAHASSAARQEAISRLAAARDGRTQEDVEALLRLISREGSLAYAQGVAESRARYGLSLLEEAFASAPDPRAARELVGLLDSLASRTS